jgi:hydrogenase maturation protease
MKGRTRSGEAGRGKVLVHGYGNPSRGDDGLGPALAAELEALWLPGTTVVSSLQLAVDDAAEVAEHEAVVFVDADTEGPAPFRFARLQPQRWWGPFSTHGVAPGALLTLADELFGKEVRGYLLGIRGYRFDEFRDSLSTGARENLERAFAFLRRALVERNLEDVARGRGAT